MTRASKADREYLERALRNPEATQFQPLPMLRLLLDLADRVDGLEKAKKPPAKKAPAKKAPAKKAHPH